jgi:hypothetical protein
MIAFREMNDLPSRDLLDPGGACDRRGCEERVAGLFDCVERLYRSVEQPGELPAALARLAELVGAASALVLAVDGQERRLVGAAHSGNAGRARLPVSSQALRTVPLAGGFELVLERGPLQDAERATLVHLAPHLGRAIRLAERLGSRPAPSELGAELDRLPLGVVLLGATREVVGINRAARGLLASCTSLGIVEQRLVATRPGPRALLETLVERVTAPPSPERRFVGGRLQLDDDCWRRLELLVVRASADRLPAGAAGAVLLSAPGGAISAEQRYRDLFGLDEREARVAVDLLVGQPPSPLSGENDAAAVVQSIYRKIGTTRQADLLHFVLRPPGVVFEQAARRRLQ